MWRETDSWFKLQFIDGTFGYYHLDAYGTLIGVYTEAGNVISPDGKYTEDENIISSSGKREFTCIDDNAPVPSWYVPPTV